jgi:cysteine desulfurase
VRAYLDHAATTPLSQPARDAMMAAFDVVGNGSAIHSDGRAARKLVEESRERVASALGVGPTEVIFTSGGTESDNLAIKGLWWSRIAAEPTRRRVLCTRIEHHAVLDSVAWLGAHEGAEVVWLDVDSDGLVDPEQVARELDAGPAALATVMWANNEVGVVQPIEAISFLCADHGVPLHVDAVQAVGSVEVEPHLSTTFASSAHKLGGPVGIGALIAGREVALTPLAHGGGQERKVRSGTFNVAGIAAFAAAVEYAVETLPERSKRLCALRDQLIADVRAVVPDMRVNGALGGPAVRLPGNAHLSFPGADGEALLMLLDAADVSVSTGSACTAGVTEPSYVLTAMGLDPGLARGSLRISLGSSSTRADVDQLIAALPEAVARARRVAAGDTSAALAGARAV